MLKTNVWGAGALLSLALLPSCGYAQEKLSPFAPLFVSTQPSKAAGFLLASTKTAAPIYVDGADFPVVRIAAEALAGDVEKVTTAKPTVLSTAPTPAATAVFIGTLGKSQLIDRLVAQKKLDASAIRGQWERYLITTVDNPVPGVRQALVIVGSDRRGTAYGAFSVSESIGVSPWVWWADVTPQHRDSLILSRARYTSKAPSVKYRGIFINDEDWGLQPWAKKNEPEVGSSGPKTYAHVAELLLRLKANYLWPAMHEASKAFNQIPENKVVMDRYAIVMGASHAEPMLFNNASEWKYPRNQWNYDTHSDLIKGVWEKRLQENGQYENSYTVGIRGIHDSPMQGGGTTQDGVKRLERVIADQRTLLAKYVNAKVAEVPQVFVPYKEVLPFYQAGMKVPDDVTLMWVDDNFGYIRQLSNLQEQKRSGRAGVYYHFSYLGGPQEYLWLGSTSPALTAYEMGKAYAYGADRVWVFNVGDIKPIEKEMEFGLRLAYDVDSYPVDRATNFLADFATENFGPTHAKEISSILESYYQLTSAAKPEFVAKVKFTKSQREERLAAYADLTKRVEALHAQLPTQQRDAFFQLVLYPVKGAALMEQKRAYIEWGDAAKATDAYDQIQEITATYNTQIAGGKWNGIMSSNPHNLSVFARPNAQVTEGAPKAGAPLYQLEPKDAQLSGAMKREGDTLVGTVPEQLRENNGNTAKFLINSPQAQEVDLYFLAKCANDKEDSWYAQFNDKKVSSNNNLTGKSYGWVKIMDADLRPGQNELIVEQREPGAVIKKIAIMKSGTTPIQGQINPAFTIEATNYSALKNARASQWKKVEGLGSGKGSMMLLPYQTPSIPDGDVMKAPAISYSFRGTLANCTVEPLFLPTHRVSSQSGLRYAITVDDGPTQIRDIDTLEFSGEWALNVLNGYAVGQTTHALKAGTSHTITIRLLDPGMVLSQIRIFDQPLTP